MSLLLVDCGLVVVDLLFDVGLIVVEVGLILVCFIICWIIIFVMLFEFDLFEFGLSFVDFI